MAIPLKTATKRVHCAISCTFAAAICVENISFIISQMLIKSDYCLILGMITTDYNESIN